MGVHCPWTFRLFGSFDNPEDATMDASSAEREHRWRLEKVVHLCEPQLQRRTQTAWDAASSADKASLPASLMTYQRRFVTTSTTVTIDSWDVPMCNAVLRHFGALKKSKPDTAAVAAIVSARNLCAHAVGGRVTTAMYEHHANACAAALKTLGGDMAALQKLRTCEIDGSEVTVPSSSREATALAETEKLTGNRLFADGNFIRARECYTRGLQVAGAVEPEMLSQLYNNRATASIRLKDFAPAKADAKHATELAPQWAKPHIRLAQIYYATYKPDKAVARLEMALGYATAANDTACVKEVTTKMAEYRLERDQAGRRESENLAYGTTHEMEGARLAAGLARMGLDETQYPMERFDTVMGLDMTGTGFDKKHVLLGQRASADGRLADAAREFMAAAVAGDAEGMYNYALYLLKGRGTRKNIPEAVRWLEKAASMPVDGSLQAKRKNVGIGEAMATLGNLYNGGVHFPQDKTRAREYWERSAELGVNNGLNNFGLCLMNGTHGVEKDLPRARELFRRSAECLHNEAMSNLGVLHASLLDYESAARWAESAAKFGFLPAASVAAEYKEQAKARAMLPHEVEDTVKAMMCRVEEPDLARQNDTPTREELRAIGTPYGSRLLEAKQLIADAMKAVTNPDEMMHAVDLAVRARRIDDSSLVFSREESVFTNVLAQIGKEAGTPENADLAILSSPRDPSSAVAFWNSLQLRFPEDLDITKRAACMLMFEAYAGHDFERGVQLFQRAFGLLPNPDDDSDPRTLDLLYLAGVGYFHVEKWERAQGLLTRFLKHAPADGHRKAAEANYILGVIAMRDLAMRDPVDTPAEPPHVLARFLREGDRLLRRIPDFLRDGAEKSPHRAMLRRIVSAYGLLPPELPLKIRPRPSQRRGGELLDGPRRLKELRSDNPTLQRELRANIAAMAHLVASRNVPWSIAPPRQPTQATRGGPYSPATIDELFSALKDRVCTGRVITCIVVSLPTFNGSSFQFVVEDSQREPSLIAVYNPPQSLISQLTPGREFELLNPYVRLAVDGSVMLRVDDPSAAIRVKALHVICWVCSAEQTAQQQPKRCAKCHKAIYCSKQCQTHDWRVDGHRVLCSVVSAMA